MFTFLIYLLFAVAGLALIFSVIYMMKDSGGTRNVKALSVRIGVCVVLFIVILIGLATGKIVPSNTLQPPAQQQDTQ